MASCRAALAAASAASGRTTGIDRVFGDGVEHEVESASGGVSQLVEDASGRTADIVMNSGDDRNETVAARFSLDGQPLSATHGPVSAQAAEHTGSALSVSARRRRRRARAARRNRTIHKLDVKVQDIDIKVSRIERMLAAHVSEGAKGISDLSASTVPGDYDSRRVSGPSPTSSEMSDFDEHSVIEVDVSNEVTSEVFLPAGDLLAEHELASRMVVSAHSIAVSYMQSQAEERHVALSPALPVALASWRDGRRHLADRTQERLDRDRQRPGWRQDEFHVFVPRRSLPVPCASSLTEFPPLVSAAPKLIETSVEETVTAAASSSTDISDAQRSELQIILDRRLIATEGAVALPIPCERRGDEDTREGPSEVSNPVFLAAVFKSWRGYAATAEERHVVRVASALRLQAIVRGAFAIEEMLMLQVAAHDEPEDHAEEFMDDNAESEDHAEGFIQEDVESEGLVEDPIEEEPQEMPRPFSFSGLPCKPQEEEQTCSTPHGYDPRSWPKMRRTRRSDTVAHLRLNGVPASEWNDRSYARLSAPLPMDEEVACGSADRGTEVAREGASSSASSGTPVAVDALAAIKQVIASPDYSTQVAAELIVNLAWRSYEVVEGTGSQQQIWQTARSFLEKKAAELIESGKDPAIVCKIVGALVHQTQQQSCAADGHML